MTTNDNLIPLAEMPTWKSGILQSSVHRNVKRMTDDYLFTYKLSTMHWLIIGAILDAGENGIRLTDLAPKVGTTLGYLTNAINTLELKKMVKRTERNDDTRTKMLTIPDDFKSKTEEIENGLRDLFRERLYVNLTREQLEVYITVLQILAKA